MSSGPYLCREHINDVGTAIRSQDTVASPVALSPRQQTAASQSRVGRLVGVSISNKAQPRSPQGNAAVGVDNAGVAMAASSMRTIAEFARNLPLDPATRLLSDTMPTDIGGVELRLGLRRTRVAANDLRGRTPSVPELVQMLEPKVRSSQ
jgi:hypothetical protein